MHNKLCLGRRRFFTRLPVGFMLLVVAATLALQPTPNDWRTPASTDGFEVGSNPASTDAWEVGSNPASTSGVIW
jgi:hypothetical protein